MRAFLTGASGFVGGHLRSYLEGCGDEVTPLGDDLDLGDASVGDELVRRIGSAEPEVIYHLAGLTHVGRSWDNPAETMRVNALGTLAALEAARRLAEPPRVVLISSAEVYGSGSGHPLRENDALRPVTPYAASKVAAEYLGLQAFIGRGLEVVRARPFNHVGPGQADAFVVSALARRIVEAERAGGGQIPVGNLEAARDFTDVRDVVRAYRLLALQGVPGDVYNVCSGRARTIADIFSTLLSLATVPIEAKEDPALFRPVDVPLIVGNGSLLQALTGWRPEIPIETTLVDVLAEWRSR